MEDTVYIFDYVSTIVYAVKLTEEEKAQADYMEEELDEDFSCFVEGVLMERLGLNSDDCNWMVTERREVVFVNGNEEKVVKIF